MLKVIAKKSNSPKCLASSMGCRTYNGYDVNYDFKQIINQILDKKDVTSNLFSGNQKDGRGNLAPVSIILPTLAMEAKEKTEREGNYVFISNGISGMSDEIYKEEIIKNFMEILDQKIHEAKDMLLERFELLASQSPESAKFMYENNTMFGYVPEEGIISALKHGTLAVGL